MQIEPKKKKVAITTTTTTAAAGADVTVAEEFPKQKRSNYPIFSFLSPESPPVNDSPNVFKPKWPETAGNSVVVRVAPETKDIGNDDDDERAEGKKWPSIDKHEVSSMASYHSGDHDLDVDHATTTIN